MDFSEILNKAKESGVKVTEDFESQPQALDGQYVGEITKVSVFNNDNGSKLVSLSIKIVSTVSGNKGDGRYLNKKYTLGESVFPNKVVTPVENMEKFLEGLKTMGLWDEQMTFKDEADMLSHVELNAVGKVVNISTWPQKESDKVTVKRDTKGWPKQTVKIVKEFKAPKVSKVVVDEEPLF